jgi:hypothetical protein
VIFEEPARDLKAKWIARCDVAFPGRAPEDAIDRRKS